MQQTQDCPAACGKAHFAGVDTWALLRHLNLLAGLWRCAQNDQRTTPSTPSSVSPNHCGCLVSSCHRCWVRVNTSRTASLPNRCRPCTTALGATSGRLPGSMMSMWFTTSQADMRRNNAIPMMHHTRLSSGRRRLRMVETPAVSKACFTMSGSSKAPSPSRAFGLDAIS